LNFFFFFRKKKKKKKKERKKKRNTSPVDKSNHESPIELFEVEGIIDNKKLFSFGFKRVSSSNVPGVIIRVTSREINEVPFLFATF